MRSIHSRPVLFVSLGLAGLGCSSPEAAVEETHAASLGDTPCADGTSDQVFFGGMVACTGNVAWADRASLCGPSYRPARSLERDGLNGYELPITPLWLDDSTVPWSDPAGTVAAVGTLCVPNRGCADGSSASAAAVSRTTRARRRPC
jgi:hypothetical protein